MILMILSACSTNETSDEPQEPRLGGEEAVDPLVEARKKLFEELGIQEENANAKKEAPLPPVLPTPPELPKTDADWPGN